MSRSFFKFLKPFISGLFSEYSSNPVRFNKVTGLNLGKLSSIMILGHSVYALGTVESKVVKINKKYMFDRNGFTEFMIIDDNGKHYNVNNSLWYWKWNSIEDWNKLETNNDTFIKYYGWRVPLLGIFPNIVESSNVVGRI
jgi:hypothetical protein